MRRTAEGSERHGENNALVSEQHDAGSKTGDVPYRRRYVRVSVSTPVTYTREGDETPRTGFSSDLGGGGMRVASTEDLPLGSVLLLRYSLPGVEREIVARGRIVLSFYNAEDQRFFHGLAFTSIDPRDQDEIVRFVAAEVQRLALEGEPAE
jgi:c-di-GMP-binding flagellar brake protein YcgR